MVGVCGNPVGIPLDPTESIGAGSEECLPEALGPLVVPPPRGVEVIDNFRRD